MAGFVRTKDCFTQIECNLSNCWHRKEGSEENGKWQGELQAWNPDGSVDARLSGLYDEGKKVKAEGAKGKAGGKKGGE